jgi:hypothetical protein
MVSANGGWSAFDTAASSPGGRGRKETIWQFVERSTEPIAGDTRARWDAWLARMPAEPRAALIHRLKGRNDDHVRAALAELVTFVLLDAVYPAVDIEPETGTGSRTDFAVDVPVRTHFEVRRKTAPEALTGDARRRADMMAELERIESPDFWLDVDAFSGAQIPSMRRVRQEAEQWLDSLDYDDQVRRRDQDQQARRERLARPMPSLDAGPLERARYLAAQRQFAPPAFERSGEGWKVVITAHPRPADKRGPGQFTIGLGAAGAAHIENAEAVEATIRRKLSQHTGLTDPLVIILDLSSPLIDDSEIAAMLYGPVAMTMLDPATVLSVARDRTKGIWPQSLTRPSRPAAVLVLRGVWLASDEVTADLWLPPDADSPILPGPWNIRTLDQDQQSVIMQAATQPTADYLQ